MTAQEAEQEICRACGAFLLFKGFDLIKLANEADRSVVRKAVEDLTSEMARRSDGTFRRESEKHS